jgi:hypothetical protein
LTPLLVSELISAAAVWLRSAQLSHFGCDDGESFAVFSGTGGFDCRIQGEEIGFASDFLNYADFLGNLLHGRDRLYDGIATHASIFRGFGGNLVCLASIVGILLNAGGHFFHG